MTDSLPEPALSPDQSTELPPANRFPAEVSARICRHMNQDHSDAVLLYAQGLAGLRTATAAQMEAIDCEGWIWWFGRGGANGDSD
jgi:putative heme iron utilization protein